MKNVEDMIEDGCKVAVMFILREMDESGNSAKWMDYGAYALTVRNDDGEKVYDEMIEDLSSVADHLQELYTGVSIAEKDHTIDDFKKKDDQVIVFRLGLQAEEGCRAASEPEKVFALAIKKLREIRSQRGELVSSSKKALFELEVECFGLMAAKEAEIELSKAALPGKKVSKPRI